jgi:hypothetical protein
MAVSQQWQQLSTNQSVRIQDKGMAQTSASAHSQQEPYGVKPEALVFYQCRSLSSAACRPAALAAA